MDQANTRARRTPEEQHTKRPAAASPRLGAVLQPGVEDSLLLEQQVRSQSVGAPRNLASPPVTNVRHTSFEREPVKRELRILELRGSQ